MAWACQWLGRVGILGDVDSVGENHDGGRVM